MSNLTDRGLSFSRAYKLWTETKAKLQQVRSELTQLEDLHQRQQMEVTRLQRELIEGAKAL